MTRNNVSTAMASSVVPGTYDRGARPNSRRSTSTAKVAFLTRRGGAFYFDHDGIAVLALIPECVDSPGEEIRHARLRLRRE